MKDGDKILDIGAGAGEYSLYFARKGYEVSALELADANIAAFKKKPTNVPYGYKHDSDDPKKWVIDEEAAQIVKRIFTLYME